MFPPALRPCVPSVDATARGGTCPGSPVTAGSSQGGAGAAGTSRPACPRGRLPRSRLPLLLPFLLLAPPLRAVRGIRGRIASSASAPPLRSGPPRARPRPAASRACPASTRRRHPQPGPRADPAAVRGQHLLLQPLAACATASGPVHAAATPVTSTDISTQRMPLPLRFPRIGQAPLQHRPERHRIRAVPQESGATRSVSQDEARGAVSGPRVTIFV